MASVVLNSDLTDQLLNLQAGDHLCLFYESDPEEQMPALIPFIKDAHSRDEQFVYIADDQTVGQLAEHLEQGGIDVKTECRKNRLKLWTRAEWRQTGDLSSERKAAQVRQFIDQAFKDGFKGISFGVEMTWTLGPTISAAQLEHWEATINTIFVPGFPGRIICQYNQSRLDPEALLAGLHTHPHAIIGNDVCPNPFYQAPLILKHGPLAATRGANNSSQRLEWMIGQLREARETQRHHDDLVRQRTEAADAEHSQQMVANILEAIPDGFLATNNDWILTKVNATAEQLLNRLSKDLVGHSLWTEFPALQAAWPKQEPRPIQVEFEYFDPALGNWLEVRSFSLGTGVAILLREVSERKQDELAARRLAAIVESSSDAIIGKDLNSIITSWNHGAEMIFGYQPEEVIGQPVMILMPPEKWNEEPGILARIHRGERIDHYETIRRRKDGELIDVSLTVSPIKDRAGRIIGASKIVRDITDRKRSEQHDRVLFELIAIVNRASRMTDIYDAALDAMIDCLHVRRASVLLYDERNVMRFKAWRGLSETYREAVEGHSPWHPEDTDPQIVCINDVAAITLDEHLRSVIEEEGIRALAFIPITIEKRLLGKFMVYHDKPHQFSPEELRRARTIVSQVALAIERRRSRDELERVVRERTASLSDAVQQMEEFSYTVSHDLRAPLRAMQIYATALDEDFSAHLPDAARTYLTRLRENAARLDRMILDVLTFTRIARTEIPMGRVSLDKVVHDVVDHYPNLNTSGAQITVEPLLDVIGNEPSLTQAISNLLSNAVKFVAKGQAPKVRVRAEKRNGNVRLWVEDNGIGIDPKYHHRLFNMFERIHPDLKYDGTGVGLAIVRKAVERMGGLVGVESKGTDSSRFWIELPAAETNEGTV